MISDLITMNGYGIYVWSSFAFTLLGFLVCISLLIYNLKKSKKDLKKISQRLQKNNITLL